MYSLLPIAASLSLVCGCATPFQKRAAQLDAVRLDVTARSSGVVTSVDESVAMRLDDQRLSEALRMGIGESVGRVWLPFAVELVDGSPAAAVLAVHGGPAHLWQSHDGAVLLDWPIELEFQDEDGTNLLSRSVRCVDRVVFPVEVLISATFAQAPAALQTLGTEISASASAPTSSDPQRAYESLARSCGRLVVESLAAAAR